MAKFGFLWGEDVHRHYILSYDQQHAITIPDVNKGEVITQEVLGGGCRARADMMQG
jgi:hypothetical protein